MKSWIAVAALLLLASCVTLVKFQPGAADGFVARQDGAHRYFVYRPAGWSADKKWPVIVYLHGGAERGSDGVLPTQVGLGPVVQRSRGAFPFVVVFPQCSSGALWMEKGEEEKVMRALDRTIAEDAGDPDRVYLTGNSLGGYGTFILGAVHADRFAALVPICGGAAPPGGRKLPPGAPFANAPDPLVAAMQAIGKTPLWAFAGADDWIVNPNQTRNAVTALHRLGNEARMTIYDGVGHDSWDRTYADPKLFEWLLQQSRAAK